MTALIIRKEWLDQILDGSKTWEMRSRPTKVRGRILLIEAGSGRIVGECILTGSPTSPMPVGSYHFNKHRVSNADLLRKWCYPWILKDAKRYDKPIPYTHPKGAVVWVNIEEDTLTAPSQK